MNFIAKIIKDLNHYNAYFYIAYASMMFGVLLPATAIADNNYGIISDLAGALVFLFYIPAVMMLWITVISVVINFATFSVDYALFKNKKITEKYYQTSEQLTLTHTVLSIVITTFIFVSDLWFFAIFGPIGALFYRTGVEILSNPIP